MKRFTPLLALLLAATAIDANAQLVVHTTSFFTGTNFNGFEGISDPFPLATPYTEGGITVEYIPTAPGGGTDIWTTFLRAGARGWYPDGGHNGYTDIKLASGAAFSNFQLLVGSGCGGCGDLFYQFLLGGSVVATGDAGGLSGFTDRGFSGILMDEVRLQEGFTAFDPNAYEALAIDNLEITEATSSPEPASLILLATGLVGVVGMVRRKRAALAH